jgi:hypothetical protein
MQPNGGRPTPETEPVNTPVATTTVDPDGGRPTPEGDPAPPAH